MGVGHAAVAVLADLPLREVGAVVVERAAWLAVGQNAALDRNLQRTQVHTPVRLGSSDGLYAEWVQG